MYDIFSKLLERNNKRAADVSKATGIPGSTFTDWKKGKSSPKTEKMQKIADYFNVSLDYLTGNSYIEDMGRIIQQERIHLGIEQQELASEVNIPSEDLDSYEADFEVIREDIYEDILSVLGTTHLELLSKYDMYDEYIPSHLNGDVLKWEAFKKARESDMISEYQESEEVLLISRAARKMTPEKRKKLLEMAKIMFSEDFDD